jgi:hypothetical protein
MLCENSTHFVNGRDMFTGYPEGYAQIQLGMGCFWGADCWNETHKDRPKTARARRDGDCNYRVMKGGSWVTHGYQMRAAARIRYVKDYRYDDYGFRLARTLE